MNDLKPVAMRLGHWSGGLRLGSGMDRKGQLYQVAQVGQIAAKMKKLMIRHTKSQQIAGSAALALPTLKPVWCFPMSSYFKIHPFSV